MRIADCGSPISERFTAETQRGEVSQVPRSKVVFVGGGSWFIVHS
jgi:hypothetical protein